MNTPAILVVLSLFISSFSPFKPARTETKWLTNSKGLKLHKEEEKQFNNYGDMVKWVQYSDYGVSCEIFTYKYSGNLKSESTRAYCDRKEQQLTTYTYDRLGRLVQETEYDTKNHLRGRTVNRYKGNTNQKTQSESFEKNEKQGLSMIDYEYYPNGLLKREVQTASGSWFGTTEYKYDESKHLIYMAAQVDGGVGWVKTYYIYKDGLLVKDIVKVPDTGIEYHSYVNVEQ